MLVLRSVATNVQPRSPFFIFPRDAGEERDGGMIDLNDCAQIDARVDCRLESFGPAQDRLREGSAFKMSHYPRLLVFFNIEKHARCPLFVYESVLW